jgi:hypothetical protein
VRGRKKVSTITIKAVVDTVAALASDDLAGQVYLMDNNRLNGSTHEGTEVLKTAVKNGDEIIWVVALLECEASVRITRIDIDKEFCEPKPNVYEGTNVTYWLGVIKKDLDGDVPYNLGFHLASKTEEMIMPSSPCLIRAAASFQK